MLGSIILKLRRFHKIFFFCYFTSLFSSITLHNIPSNKILELCIWWNYHSSELRCIILACRRLYSRQNQGTLHQKGYDKIQAVTDHRDWAVHAVQPDDAQKPAEHCHAVKNLRRLRHHTVPVFPGRKWNVRPFQRTEACAGDLVGPQWRRKKICQYLCAGITAQIIPAQQTAVPPDPDCWKYITFVLRPASFKNPSFLSFLFIIYFHHAAPRVLFPASSLNTSGLVIITFRTWEYFPAALFTEREQHVYKRVGNETHWSSIK